MLQFNHRYQAMKSLSFRLYPYRVCATDSDHDMLLMC